MKSVKYELFQGFYNEKKKHFRGTHNFIYIIRKIVTLAYLLQLVQNNLYGFYLDKFKKKKKKKFIVIFYKLSLKHWSGDVIRLNCYLYNMFLRRCKSSAWFIFRV